jgi:D-glutamate cyclase
MSPRRSEFEAIEALVCRDVGRGTQALIDATHGELASAARSLAQATSIGLITGFFVPRGDVAAAETDGPVGTALLAAALAACGVAARIAVDSPCADVVRAAAAASGHEVKVDEVGVVDRAGIERVTEAWKQDGVSHVVAIERCGIAADGRPRNMRGVDVSPWTAPLDDLFLGGTWRRIAVGDGGNEIGMGKLPAGLIAQHVPNGAEIACVTPCDELVVAGVSNWGAYGLMAALALVRPEWSATIARFLTAELDLSVTRAIVAETGAVDGVTAQREATVDGFGPEVHGAVIDGLRRIAWGKAAA